MPAAGHLGPAGPQPARPLTPTDKAAVERFFRTLSEGLLAALPGYKGPDVYSRGADPEGCAYFFTSELEQVIREWISVDDVHFLDISRRDGREVANHFKWLANVFPVTFLFVGVGLRARGLLDEGLSGADAAFSQAARRWNVLTIDPFEIRTQAGQRTWRKLLLGIERELVLTGAWRGMIAGDLTEYLFARSTGHLASLMSLISRGCYRAVRTGAESLTASLLDQVRIDQAAEDARGQLQAAIGTGQPAARPGTRASAPAAGEAVAV